MEWAGTVSGCHRGQSMCTLVTFAEPIHGIRMALVGVFEFAAPGCRVAGTGIAWRSGAFLSGWKTDTVVAVGADCMSNWVPLLSLVNVRLC